MVAAVGRRQRRAQVILGLLPLAQRKGEHTRAGEQEPSPGRGAGQDELASVVGVHLGAGGVLAAHLKLVAYLDGGVGHPQDVAGGGSEFVRLGGPVQPMRRTGRDRSRNGQGRDQGLGRAQLPRGLQGG